MCRVANAEYSLAQSHGENEKEMVGASCCKRVRAKIAELLKHGWSLNQICKVSGVPETSVHNLLYGHANTPRYRKGEHAGLAKPTTKMSRRNYVALMALPEKPVVADSALVDGRALARGVKWAVAHGYSCAAIAREAGVDSQVVYRLSHALGDVTVRHISMHRLAPVLIRYKKETEDGRA